MLSGRIRIAWSGLFIGAFHALWREANDAFKGLAREPHGNPGLDRNEHRMLPKGLLHCGVCGHRLTPKPGGKKDKDGNLYLYYTCNNVSKDGKAAACTLRNVPARAMDDLVRRVIGEIGRHPDAIKAAVAASNEQKSRSLRPLKSRLAELQRRHRELSDELQRYFQMARQSDSGHFGKEAMAAAEELARQKHEVEQGIEKVKIDIAYRERVVTDERLIARALLSFEKSTKALSFEE